MDRARVIYCHAVWKFYCNTYSVTFERNDDANPPQLPIESLDDAIRNLKIYRSNDDNNNFNYGDIDKEILQFKYEDLIEESKTIVFYDCNDNVDAIQ